MKATNKTIHSASSTGVMDQPPTTEGLWSECFLDLDSWCLQPQDEEFNTHKTNNQNEYTFSFDDQSKYCKWNGLSPLGQSGGNDMWEPSDNLVLSPSCHFEEDNNNLQTHPSDKSSYKGYIKNEDKESPIRYSGNLVLTQCSYDDCRRQPEAKMGWGGTSDSSVAAVAPSSIFPVAAAAAALPATTTVQKQNSNTPDVLLPTTTSNQNDFTLQSPELDYKWEEFGVIKEDPDLFGGVASKPKKTRAPLKLNMGAALANKDVSSFSLSTPDVLQSLSEDPGFSILSFVCDGGDEQNLLGDQSSSSGSAKVLPKSELTDNQQVNSDAILSDHDYTDTRTVSEEGLFTKLEIIKEEALSPKFSDSRPGKRRRKHTAASEDYVFDSEALSDDSSDWSPSSSRKPKAKRRNSRQTGKRTRLSSESDSCSVISGPDRYRELRDRNNEASRRSRMNRKQKELQMLDMASSLEDENVVLKNRASSLEKRVKALRQILMKVVLDRNSKT